jgi:hypothetical protein
MLGWLIFNRSSSLLKVPSFKKWHASKWVKNLVHWILSSLGLVQTYVHTWDCDHRRMHACLFSITMFLPCVKEVISPTMEIVFLHYIFKFCLSTYCQHTSFLIDFVLFKGLEFS